jgi:hypothetical protein
MMINKRFNTFLKKIKILCIIIVCIFVWFVIKFSCTYMFLMTILCGSIVCALIGLAIVYPSLNMFVTYSNIIPLHLEYFMSPTYKNIVVIGLLVIYSPYILTVLGFGQLTYYYAIETCKCMNDSVCLIIEQMSWVPQSIRIC